MIIYQLKRKVHYGSGWSKMTLDNDVIFFAKKEDAKALQNPFNGDRVTEIVLTNETKFIYNIRLIHNTASWGNIFPSLKEAKTHCEKADKTKYHREVYKNKIYNSLSDYKKDKTEPKRVYA